MEKLENKILARYLGPSHDIGQAMCSKLLTVKGKEISRTSVIPLSIAGKNSKPVQQLIDDFDQELKKVLGDRAAGLPVNAIVDDTPEFEPYLDDTMSEPIIVKDADDSDLDTYHKLISAWSLRPRGEERAPARVIKRKLEDNGKLIGTANPNPLLDSSVYEVLFDDGDTEYNSANAIAETFTSKLTMKVICLVQWLI
jgi:hypothetical protein